MTMEQKNTQGINCRRFGLFCVLITLIGIVQATPIHNVEGNDEGLGNLERKLNGQTLFCKITTCPKGFEVQPCTKNFTSDNCSPCPPGKQMLDNTTSELYVRHCTDIPSCDDWPNTVYSAEPYYCTGLPLHCKCDTVNKYCGPDPCQCNNTDCQNDEVLQQNCSCVKRSFDPELPPASVPTTKEEAPVTVEPVVDHVTDAETDSDSQTQHPDISMATSKPVDNTESPSISEQKVSASIPVQYDGVNWKTFGVTIGTIIGLLLVALAVFIVYKVYKARREYSAVPTNEGNPPGCIHTKKKDAPHFTPVNLNTLPVIAGVLIPQLVLTGSPKI